MNGFNNGLVDGELLVHNHGLIEGSVRGLIGDNDSISTYCTEAKILFQAMTVQPDKARKVLINNTIKRLKSEGIWEKLDLLYMFAGHNSTDALLNWKAPSSYKLVPQSSPTFTVDRGYTGNGSNQYFKTGWIPSSSSVNFGLNTGFIAAYSRTNITPSSIIIMGSGSSAFTSQIGIYPRLAGGKMSGFISCDSGNASCQNTVSDTLGMLTARRIGVTLWGGKRGVEFTGNGIASNPLNSFEMYLLAYNNNGSTIAYYNGQTAFHAVGSGQINTTTFNNIIEVDYLTSIGANV